MEYTIRDLLQIVSFNDVARIIKNIYYYEDEVGFGDVAGFVVESYRSVFEELKTYERWMLGTDDRLVIEASEMVDNEKRWYSVSMRKEYSKDDPQHKQGEVQNYAIDFIDWKVLLDVPIEKETMKHYTSEDIVAHFLWEITFHGYSREEVARKYEEIISRADEEPLTKWEDIK